MRCIRILTKRTGEQLFYGVLKTLPNNNKLCLLGWLRNINVPVWLRLSAKNMACRGFAFEALSNVSELFRQVCYFPKFSWIHICTPLTWTFEHCEIYSYRLPISYYCTVFLKILYRIFEIILHFCYCCFSGF